MFEKILNFSEKNVFENYIGVSNINNLFHDLLQLKEYVDDNNFLFNKSFPLNINTSKYKILNNKLLKDDQKFSNFLLDNFDFSTQEIDAYLKIKTLFLEDKKNNGNLTLLLNFIIKILYWREIYIIPNDKSNIFLFIGNIKKHEYYFLIFLYLLNWNVVYINGENFNPLINFNINFKEISLIDEKIYEKINEEDFLKYLNNKKNELVKINFSNMQKIIDYLIDFKDKSFYYLIFGVDENKENYENNLILIKELFEKKFNNYIIFENNIQKPTLEEINELQLLYNDTNPSIDNLINILPNIKNKKDIIIKFFDKYKKNFQNDSIFYNFQISILVLLNRYNNFLFNYSGIIFFGNIRKQDLYFLNLLNMLDVSILYINPNKSNIIKEDISSLNVIEFENSLKIDNFPKEKNIKKQETITYKVEQQIKDVLHSGNEAILNPFQLNSKKMISKLLISTLDEYLVLWKEPTQFRTGFNNLDNKVEIPNMFIKINGIYKNIKKYWKMVNEMKKVENCIFFEDINFLNQISIDQQEFYKMAYLFDKNGFLKKDELINSNIYKNRLSYLNQDIQNLILDKLDLLFKENIFTTKIDMYNRIDIIFTILYLDDNILNVIQKHKFGEKNPKLLLYNNKKTIYPFRECAIMCFLCLLGFDVAILTPTNYNVIEQTISSDFFYSLMLEDVCYDLKYNKKSFFNFFNMLY